MKQTVRHGLGIALSAMAFLCNYSPWVREAASLPDALTLTSGQKFVVQTGLPMLAASDGGAVSVLASQDERVTISAEAGGQTSVTFSLLGLIPVHETRVNVVEERTLIPGGQAVGVALKTRGVLVVSDAAKGRALRAGDVILSADGKNVESTKALSEQVGHGPNGHRPSGSASRRADDHPWTHRPSDRRTDGASSASGCGTARRA